MQFVLKNSYVPHFFCYLLFNAASILKPYEKFRLFRNPKLQNQGKLITLSEFLSLTEGSRILIGIEVRSSTSILDYISLF